MMYAQQTLVAPEKTALAGRQTRVQQLAKSLAFLRSPLWLCLAVSLLVRIWLVIHTHGVIEGDEALVGIQAQHIVQGERPVYFYAQPYMGSLEAYFIALLFTIFGSSVWTLRAEPVILSLVVVWLTWQLADALAKHLPRYARVWFKLVAALFAALPPLYDIVLETRTYGGYIETLILMLLLLLSVVRLTQRWHEASRRELALRWAAIGLIVGLGFWVYPLIVIAILTVSLWLIGFCIIESIRPLLQKAQQPLSGLHAVLHGLVFIVAAVPTFCIGAAPALSWGATHHWENVTYLLKNSNDPSQNRLHIIAQVTHLYRTCTALRIIGGAVPTEPYVTMAHPHLLTASLILGSFCIAGAALALGLSFLWHHPLFVQTRLLAGLPLLFAACSALIFCTSSISAAGIHTGCGPKDLVGRYGAPLVLALPFFAATLFALAVQFMHNQTEQWEQAAIHEKTSQVSKDDNATPLQGTVPSSRSFLALHLILALMLLLYLGIQTFAYTRASANYLFQTSGCVIAPLDDTPIINYMHQEHIQYAWATSWVANPITFKTHSEVLVIDPRIVAYPASFINRIPSYTAAVANAQRASALILVPTGQQHPPLLKQLDAQHVTYRVARFTSEPGYELLVVTPLNQRLSPKLVSDTSAWFGGC